MRYVLTVFDWSDHRDKRVAKYCLGHASERQGDSYDHIDLKNDKALENTLGTFTPLTEADMTRFEAIVAGDD